MPFSMPPPLPYFAWLPERVLLLTVSVPPLSMPPPSKSAELPESVQVARQACARAGVAEAVHGVPGEQGTLF
jgi:hypothetical protein